MHDKIAGIAGVSGSGKSSPALGVRIDIPFQELTKEENKMENFNHEEYHQRNNLHTVLLFLLVVLLRLRLTIQLVH